ncbi:murein DD-endopeptidase MepM/ murein hydrolase activator NlpD [Pedobacter cryoconitis]|uniref:Murein DD-endopeptidase MepM/ murein hydrolase activator NlpD n=1 Tax=Pedobacter cryoconitis TaxID=188932 RepID=A0A7W8ZLS7_9SPHI|nr:M23 family metallopeptidase [Pedobacter cryoconitis]MBB5636230.1 murein DD-endopeptidase MepM/ murein hydrolase activator NlpD [Pedobacter cryoconitis]MBB6272852.1 murein DD-endopeptidase MepM/ murein hydrolase activator NlpD [Pedobacter cryoconitis]
MIKKSIFLFLLSVLTISTQAQQIFSNNKYPLVDFRPPLDIVPPALAGSFGELRGNHFHSGIDFRTNQREGYPVHAIADGYVSRMRVQNSGFGLALYLVHPNGYTSVYGHLSRFAPKIAEAVKALEYQKKTFELDEFPAADLFPVHKGDVIAYSGNRGSSGGPHLHFEIRDSKTENTINPQLFGIQIPDNIPPVIYSLYVYKLNKKPFSEYTPKIAIPITGAAGKYAVAKAGPVIVSGEVGFGITATDRHNGASGINGVYSIELEVDGQTVFTSSLEKFAFENSKAINSHIDYPALMTSRRSIQKSFVDPGNPLQIYSNLVNNGRIEFKDQQVHELKYIVTDAKGNKSILPFTVKSDGQTVISTPDQPDGIPFFYNKENEFSTAGVKVVLPKGTLYNDFNLVYKVKPEPARGAYSPVYQIHNNLTPLHIGFDLWIKADARLGALKDKAVIVSTSGASQGGVFENGYVKATPRNFGSFYIAVDTVAPSVTPVNIADGKNMAGIAKMIFKIHDNLSGIKSFNGYIDGNWVLMEFDTKTATLWHSFDERTTTGKHHFKLVVEDMKGNIKTYSINFIK